MSQQLTVLQSLRSALPSIPSKQNENHYRQITTAAESTKKPIPLLGGDVRVLEFFFVSSNQPCLARTQFK
jgi:hypothetical protein